MSVKAGSSPLLSLISVALAGCTFVPAGRSALPQVASRQAAALNAAAATRVYDLAGDQPVKAGYGRIAVRLETPARTRGTSAVGTQFAIITVTRPGGEKVSDENGADAVYSQSVSAGTATFVLPGLPSTTTQLSGSLTSAAYVVSALIGDWDAYTPPTGYASLDSTASAVAQLNYGTNTSTTFVLDQLGKDLVTSDAVPAVSSMLLASAWGRADVTPGIIPTATLTTFTHLQMDFQNSPLSLADALPGTAEYLALIQKGKANVTSLSGLTTDSAGTLRLRQPGLDPGSIDPIPTPLGTIGAFHRVGRVTVQLTGNGASFTGFTPRITAEVFDPANATYLTLMEAASAKSFTGHSLADQFNGAFNLTGQVAWADLDLSGSLTGNNTFTISALTNAKDNIVDMTLTGLPPNAAVRVYFLPVGTAYAMSGPYTPNAF